MILEPHRELVKPALRDVLRFSPPFGNGLPFARPPKILGGIANPTEIAGCKLWLRADLGVTIATGVSVWADQSGNGNDFTQGTAANQPAFNASDINGKPSVQFDGVNDLLTSAGTSTGIMSINGGFYNYFWFAVMRNDVGTAAPGNGYDAKALFSDQGSYIAMGFGSDVMSVYHWEPGEQPVRPAVTTATWAQAYQRYNSVRRAGSWNKGAESSVTCGFAIISSTLKMGQNYGSGLAVFAGRIAEFVAYNRDLNSAELVSLQNYATARYGV